jgi:threonine synthase
MKQLKKNLHYEVDDYVKAALKEHFFAGSCNDAQTKRTIAEAWSRHRYLLDPHTAVAWDVAEQYKQKVKDDTPTVVVSTASPFKFADSVLPALGENAGEKDNELRLSELTGRPVPAPLTGLFDKPVRFDKSVGKNAAKKAVRGFVFDGTM